MIRRLDRSSTCKRCFLRRVGAAMTIVDHQVVHRVTGADLAQGTPLVIYSQFAGDHTGPTRMRGSSQHAGFEFAFEPLPSRPVFARHPQTNQILEGQSCPVLTGAQSAETIARLISLALLARREPRRLQPMVRTGSPEQLLVAKYSEDSAVVSCPRDQPFPRRICRVDQATSRSEFIVKFLSVSHRETSKRTVVSSTPQAHHIEEVP